MTSTRFDQHWSTGHIISQVDSVSVLTVYLVLSLAIPSRLVVGPLGAAGSPASLWALLMCALWVWSKLNASTELPPVGHRPIRWATGLVAISFLTSYYVAARRPISPDEMSTADIGLLSLFGWLGVVLLANDGIFDPARLRGLLRRIVVAGGLLGVLGLVQFVSGESFVEAIQIPGLTSNTPALGVAERNGFNRPAGTAIHAIEFSVVITMILPVAVALALQRDGRALVARWWPVATMVAVIPLAISRSAIVGAAVGLLVLLPSLSRVVRRMVIVVGVMAVTVTFITVPGLVGSMARLFLNVSDDGSARSRTDSYGLVAEYFERNPLLGRGFSTFLPSHRILDNQYLLLLMDVGLIGTVAVGALLWAGVTAGAGARRRSMNPRVGELGQALAASIAVGAVGMALFDAFSFPMAVGLLMLNLGLAGSLRRQVDERFTVSHAALSNLSRLR